MNETTNDAPREPAHAAVKPGGLGAKVGKDLGPRVATGLVLAVVGATAIWLGGYVFAALVLVGCLAIAWEWGRLVRGVDADMIMAAHAGTVAAAVVLTKQALVMPAAMAVVIGCILIALLAFGNRMRLSALGVLYASLPAIALIWLRDDGALGLWAVLLIVLAVVATDIGAYFAGRLIGGPKLAPKLSPNKTWSGLIGGMTCAALVAAAFAHFVLNGTNVTRIAGLGAVSALVAQAGDIGESALKRAFGVKDASSLLGAHGGVMDRVDGLVAAAVLLGIWAAVVNINAPARAILFGS